MKRLLKADFFRLFHSKLALVSLIISTIFPLLMAGLFYALREITKNANLEQSAMIDMMLGGRMLIGTSFSLSSNVGIILPVFAALLVMADINSGSVRGKIIIGHKRHHIFASHYLVTMTYCLVLIAVYAAMTTLWGALFLGLGEIGSEYAVSLVYFYVLGLLNFAMVAAIATCFSLTTFSTPPAVLLTLVSCLVIGLASSIISSFDYSSFEHVAYFIPGFVTSLFQNKEISATMFLEGVGGTVIFGAGFYVVGALLFNRKDLK